MNIDLSSEIVLLTGASRGIGLALCKQLLESGARVVAQYRTNKDELDKLQSKHASQLQVLPFDFAKTNQIPAFFDQALSCFGSVSCLINNAAVAHFADPEGPLTAWLHIWEETMRVNLISTALLTQLTVKQMEKAGSGRVITIVSRAAHRGDTAAYAAYAASKGGLLSFTKSLVREYGKRGIRVFALAPGFVRTDMAADFMATYGEAHVLQDVSLERLTEPDDLAPLVTFLCSGKGDHLHGSTIDINAGSYVR